MDVRPEVWAPHLAEHKKLPGEDALGRCSAHVTTQTDLDGVYRVERGAPELCDGHVLHRFLGFPDAPCEDGDHQAEREFITVLDGVPAEVCSVHKSSQHLLLARGDADLAGVDLEALLGDPDEVGQLG